MHCVKPHRREVGVRNRLADDGEIGLHGQRRKIVLLSSPRLIVSREHLRSVFQLVQLCSVNVWCRYVTWAYVRTHTRRSTCAPTLGLAVDLRRRPCVVLRRPKA